MLLAGGKTVVRTVNFDNQFLSEDNKVSDIRADGGLPPDMDLFRFQIPEMAPKRFFSGGLAVSEPPCQLPC